MKPRKYFASFIRPKDLSDCHCQLFSILIFRMGEITLELYWKHAPITCRNFAELTRRGYYNGTKFHRIIRDFMIQGDALKMQQYTTACTFNNI